MIALNNNTNIENINIEDTYVKDVYEEIADHFDHTRVNTWNWITDFLDKFKKDSIIYDIGCGNGRNMYHKHINFIGVDNCSKFIKICKNKNLNVINSNITKIPLESNSADGIICIAVLHHLYYSYNRVDALLEMKRLLVPGGKLLLSVWSLNQPKKTRRIFNNYGNNIVLWSKYSQKTYERFYYIFKIDELKNLFNKVGLVLIDHKYDCGNEIFTLMKI
jgi:tRNA (uracil-5-)-methyltransferase TRM9